MARLCALLVLAVLVQCSFATRISILGVTSDPCADSATYDSLTAGARINAACAQNHLPNSAVTIYIPSQGSQSATGASRADPQIVGAGRTVPITVLPNTVTGTPASPGIKAGQSLCLGTLNTATDVSDCSAVVAGTCSLITVSAQGVLSFTITSAWDDLPFEFEDTPRALCVQTPAAAEVPPGTATQNVYSGLQVAVVFNCGVNADCTAHPGITQSGQYNTGVVSATEARMLATRTQCCTNTALGLGAGICINPNVQSCCGGVALETSVERCCDVTNHVIRDINGACPCFGFFAGAANATGCPSNETCCLPTKFAMGNLFPGVTIEGRCYQTNVTRCCDTGELYDPGTAQCCVINGVQSLNFPCPCSIDAHCAGSSQGVNQGVASARCCRQTFPSPVEPAVCTPFANFPSATNLLGNVAPASVLRDASFRPGDNVQQVQRCPGVCIDTRFQMCCNGVACVQGYEKCCNSTCCNKFVGKCAESYRAGSSNNRVNPVNYNTPFEICTIVENLGPLKTYWVFVLPTFLLAATLSSLALVIIYASSQTTRAFSFVERAIVVLSVILVLLAIPTFFSPTYKYGMVIVIVGLIAILAASARVWWLNVLAVGAAIVLLLFLIDPFHGNWFFNFANGRLFNGNPDFEQMGILHSLDKMWTGTATYRRQDFCTQFYDYFQLDPLVQDYNRRDQQFGTFGFCIREWVAALLIIELFVILLALLIFVLLVLALTLRFRKVAPLPVAAVIEPEYVDLY